MYTYPAMQVQCAVATDPSLSRIATQAWWGVSVVAWDRSTGTLAFTKQMSGGNRRWKHVRTQPLT